MTSDLAFAGLDDHLRLLAAGQTTSEELTALFLDRIERHDPAVEVTTWGTSANETPADADAEVVRRLRAAGAVILGKTNVPELTILPFTETPTYGITRNPWDLQRTPGGSSGGGSIRIPAGCCGLFGLKPQRGRVPTAPKSEPWLGMTTWGPITRRVADSARLYDAIRDGGEPFAEAAAREPDRLRIAVSRKVPTGVVIARTDAEYLGAL